MEQHNTERHKKKENVWRRESWTRERNSWDEEKEKDWLDQGEDKVD